MTKGRPAKANTIYKVSIHNNGGKKPVRDERRAGEDLYAVERPKNRWILEPFPFHLFAE